MPPVTVVKATKPVAKKAGNPAKPAAVQWATSTKSLVSSQTSVEVEDIEDEDEWTSSIQPINPHHVLEKADGSDDELNDDIPGLVEDVDDDDEEEAEEGAEAELSKLSAEDPISQAD